MDAVRVAGSAPTGYGVQGGGGELLLAPAGPPTRSPTRRGVTLNRFKRGTRLAPRHGGDSLEVHSQGLVLLFTPQPGIWGLALLGRHSAPVLFSSCRGSRELQETQGAHSILRPPTGPISDGSTAQAFIPMGDENRGGGLCSDVEKEEEGGVGE
ncbi:unnamed protein product [Arctogadus glacialis]